MTALSTIRTQAGELDTAGRKEWNILATVLESHLEIIHACAQVLRIKLEMLKKYSPTEVDQLVQGITSKLPNRTQVKAMNAETYELEYQKAVAELGKEHHQFMGFMDIVKGMFMWIEPPETRVRKHRSLQVEA